MTQPEQRREFESSANKLTPAEEEIVEVIGEAWTQNPDRFTVNPPHLIPGPNT